MHASLSYPSAIQRSGYIHAQHQFMQITVPTFEISRHCSEAESNQDHQTHGYYSLLWLYNFVTEICSSWKTTHKIGELAYSTCTRSDFRNQKYLYWLSRCNFLSQQSGCHRRLKVTNQNLILNCTPCVIYYDVQNVSETLQSYFFAVLVVFGYIATKHEYALPELAQPVAMCVLRLVSKDGWHP